MHHRDYPDMSGTDRTWTVFGSRAGEVTTEFFRPDEVASHDGEPRRRPWVWVDEYVPVREGDDVPKTILVDAHCPHEYSGYDLHVRKQPVITTFATHDHLIIPDLDIETPGNQTVSMILHTDFIWTRRAEEIVRLTELMQSSDLHDRAAQHETAVYAFVGILRVMLGSLEQQLVRRERQTYALEDRYLQRGRHELDARAEDDRFDENPLEEYRHLTDSRTLVELRIQVAWLRKQYSAFDRVVNSLFDPAYGAFRTRTELKPEAAPYFQHLSDQIKRALTKIEHLRDTHDTLDQLRGAQEAEKTNATLLRLTWLSIIFLPVVVIVDIFGMNISLFSRNTFGIDSRVAIISICFAFLSAAIVYRREIRRDGR